MTARTFVLAATAVISLTLGGCGLGPDGSPSASPTPTSTVSAEPMPVFLPEGDAQDNKTFFDRILSGVATADQKQPGRAMVNALVRAGFRKKSIQLTPDRTRTDLEADSVIVAIRMGRSCLIGQRTNDRKYYSSIESALKTGGCLVGTTRKINW
jgi:hypothetical protein